MESGRCNVGGISGKHLFFAKAAPLQWITLVVAGSGEWKSGSDELEVERGRFRVRGSFWD